MDLTNQVYIDQTQSFKFSMITAVLDMKVLLTGFEKFLDYDINPTERVVTALNGTIIGDKQIVGKVIKLEYYTIRQQVRKYIDEEKPDAVVLTGQAGRSMICLEKVAVNYADSNGRSYNCGTVVSDEFLFPNGPAGLFSKLDIPHLLEKLHQKSIPAARSMTAGTYGCNQIFYETMYYLKEIGKDISAGFVHVPMIPEQSLNGKFATLDYSLIELAIKTIIENI